MPRGRPRNFDLDEAIGKAMVVFWTKGYEGTTIPDLTEAIGINRPSLYAAFGNKEGLFKLALDRYRSEPASYVNRALALPTAREAFYHLLRGVIELVTDPERPGGCLFVCGALAKDSGKESVQTELANRRIRGEQDILNRFRQALADDDIPEQTDISALAKLAATLLWGLSVQAANGSSRHDLERVAELALASFDAAVNK